MKVDPAEVSACASEIRDGASVWLSAHSSTVASHDGLSALGGDRVGAVLQGVLGPLTPRTAEYVQATGACTSETGALLHDVSYAYAMTFRDAKKSADQIARLVTQLGGI